MKTTDLVPPWTVISAIPTGFQIANTKTRRRTKTLEGSHRLGGGRNFKGLVARCHSFYLFFTLTEYTYNILYIILVECRSCSPHCFRSVEGHLWGAEPRFELGPAVQQADSLLSEPRHTQCGVAKFAEISKPLPLINTFWIKPLSVWSISLDSTLKDLWTWISSRPL